VVRKKKQEMFKFFILNFRKGIEKIKSNPQLAYTLFVALVIFFAFLYTSNNFVLIAKNAQDRLINVRAGSMHDVFSEFASEYIDRPEELSLKINSISERNQTIVDFKVILFQEQGNLVVACLNQEEKGKIDQSRDIPYNLALIDPNSSVTIERIIDGDRFFKTVRAITDERNNVLGVIYTKQSLSQADQIIAQNIRNGVMVLFLILAFIMLLFFRHAKIIDYAVLYRRLEQINQMKDDFISIASHELRTPLTVIRGYAEILQSLKLDKEGQEAANKIDLQSKRLSILIDDILDIPKIEQGRMNLEIKEVDPEKAIKEVVEFLQHNAQEKKLKLYSEIQESALIKVDLNRLKQVLINVVGNSIKYTEKGEIKVKVSLEDKKLVIRTSDTGIGMTAEEQRGLFQKFYRIHSKETEDIIGTGLGLWITAKIVELMKGSISIESIKNVGTHVVVSFPIVEKS
jgi:signal transduction histidine kinase